MKAAVILGLIAIVASQPVSNHDPMINEGLFEGDMLGVDPDSDRNAVPNDSQRWPRGVVPYIIMPELSRFTSLIESAMRHIESNTCIRFVKRTHEQDYVKIFKENGCNAHWGRIGGQQLLSLGDGCDNFGIILHELLHAVGFEHEHNRSDRDDYLIIKWENIGKEWYYAFKKLTPQQNRLLTPFDFNSIMLYGSKSFVKDWNTYSMLSKTGKVLPDVYDRKSISASDIQRIKMLYGC